MSFPSENTRSIAALQDRADCRRVSSNKGIFQRIILKVIRTNLPLRFLIDETFQDFCSTVSASVISCFVQEKHVRLFTSGIVALMRGILLSNLLAQFQRESLIFNC